MNPPATGMEALCERVCLNNEGEGSEPLRNGDLVYFQQVVR
jgi:hypothetical protein